MYRRLAAHDGSWDLTRCGGDAALFSGAVRPERGGVRVVLWRLMPEP